MPLASPEYPGRSGTSSAQRLLGRLKGFAKEMFTWRVLGAVFASLLVVGWIFIVIVLIQEEKWQLVLIAWLLLYSAAHFCYWYFKKHNLLPLNSQLCRRSRESRNSIRHLSKPVDLPPTYDDVMKSEHPPPTYWSIVVDSPKYNKNPNNKFSLFSIESIPNVFGRSSRPSSAQSKGEPSPHSTSVHRSVSSISGRISAQPISAAVSQPQNRNMSSRSNRSSLVRRDSMMISPLVLPIYDNLYGYPNSPEGPSGDTASRPATSVPRRQSMDKTQPTQSQSI